MCRLGRHFRPRDVDLRDMLQILEPTQRLRGQMSYVAKVPRLPAENKPHAPTWEPCELTRTPCWSAWGRFECLELMLDLVWSA